MNLVLLTDQQFTDSDTAILSDRQQQHLQKIVNAESGQVITVGKLNGYIGKAQLICDSQTWRAKIIHLDQPPPNRLPLTLILGLPRPQMIKRILQTVATMGVKKLILLQTAKVEKSFWQSPAVTETAIEHQMILGLEQGLDTVLPIIEKHTRFRPFIEDFLAQQMINVPRWIAHPGTASPPPQLSHAQENIVAIGPEGGFTEKELEYFTSVGFNGFHLGERILKVETAIPVILARLFSV